MAFDRFLVPLRRGAVASSPRRRPDSRPRQGSPSPQLDPVAFPARTALLGAVVAAAGAVGCGESRGGVEPTAPLVVETTPAEGQTGVSVLPEIAVQFDQEMDPSGGTIAVIVAGDPRPIAERRWTDGARRLALVLADALPEETAVEVQLEADFRSAAGLALPRPFRFGFRTGPDEVAPRVRSSVPSEGQLDVDVDRLEEIRVTFDEAMNTTQRQGRIFFQGEMVTVFGSWDDDDRTIRFPIETTLPKESVIQLDLGFLEDRAGNAVAGDASGGDAFLDFTSGPDIFEPFIQNTTPREGAGDVRLDLDEISVVFSEAMDETVTDFVLVPEEADVGPDLASIPLAGHYEGDGLVLILPLSGEPLAPMARYRLDLRDVRDLRGNGLPDDEAFTGDGVLDFATVPASGETCVDALDLRNGTTTDGRTTIEIPATVPGSGEGIRTADGGADSCNPSGPGPDAVVRYEKTTQSLSAGGTVLRVSARLPTGALFPDALALEVTAGPDCAPAARRFDPGQLRCTAGRSRWDAYLDVGPGTYFIFVAGESATRPFPGAVVELEEIDDPADFEGESCSAPFTTDSAIHTSISATHDRWVIPSDRINGFDMATSWGGAGVVQCIDDSVFGDRPGVDAVIAFEKDDPSSLLEVEVSGFARRFEILSHGCDAEAAERSSLGCWRSAFRPFVGGVGLSGPLHLWIAASSPALDVDVTVDIRELPAPSAGAACGVGIPLVSGDNDVSGMATAGNGRPSCFSFLSDIRWFEYTLPEEAVAIRSDGEDALVIVDRDTGEELGCQDPTNGPLARVVGAGKRICVGVEGGSTTDTLTVTDHPYDGPGSSGASRRVSLGPPFDGAAGAETAGLGSLWLAVADERAFAGRTGGTVAEISLTSGEVTDRGAEDGISFSMIARDGVVADGRLFSLSTATGADDPRLFELWDGASDPWAPAAHDLGGDYPAASFIDLLFDGEVFLMLATPSAFGIHRVDLEGGAPALLTGESGDLVPPWDFAADRDWLFLADANNQRLSRIRREDLANPDAVAEEIVPVPVGVPFNAELVVDDPVEAGYLFLRSGRSIVVIADPGGPAPAYLGTVATTGPSDRGLTRTPAGGVALVDTLRGGSLRPELVVLE